MEFLKFLEPEDVAELSAKQLLLRQAAYQSRDAVRMFYFAQMTLGILGLLAGVVYINFLGGGAGMTTQKTMMYTVGPGAIGYFLPKYWVTRRVEARKEEITRGFPDALDMMLVCVEAGQSLDQCIVRVARELRASYKALSEEFEIVAYEMKAGKRVMRAEEAANKLPTKMTLATMMLTVPPLLIILVGPSVHGITELGKMSGPGQ